MIYNSEQPNHNSINDKCQAPDTANNAVLLDNEKFSWATKKERTKLLSELMDAWGNSKYSERAWFCGSALEFNFLEANETGSNLNTAIHGKKQLSFANFCQLRTGPLCNARRSAKLAVMLSNCIDAINTEHQNARYLFLTLACKNCTADELSNTMTHILNSYHKLMRRRPVKRAIKGAFRTMEITYNESQNTYHPHLHILLVVTEDYFPRANGLYITQDEWVKMWSECLKVDYLATANIKRADKNKKAIAEVSKYAIKDTDYLKLAERNKKKAVEVIKTYTWALYKRRLIQASGWFKEHWDEAQEDDLMHINETGDKHSAWYGQYSYGYKSLKNYFLRSVYEYEEDADNKRMPYTGRKNIIEVADKDLCLREQEG